MRDSCFISSAGNFVMIAEVDSLGNLTDARVFATSKIALCTANVSVAKTVTINIPAGAEGTQYVEIGFSGFSRFLYKGNVFDNKNIPLYNDLSAGEYVRITTGNVTTAYKGGYVKKSGSGLIFKNYSANNQYYKWNETLEFEVV